MVHHATLTECTVLDALAGKAGLTADKHDQHDTLDPQNDARLPADRCEPKGPRNYLELYKETYIEGMESPDQNAESYAAVATEIYFMEKCGFSQVRPAT